MPLYSAENRKLDEDFAPVNSEKRENARLCVPPLPLGHLPAFETEELEQRAYYEPDRRRVEPSSRRKTRTHFHPFIDSTLRVRSS